MTSRGKDDLDDEFEAFLAGRGELARQLSALPQPESPALLNDAIIASIKAEMAQEQATLQRPAANDAGDAAGDAAAMPPTFQPSWMMRWRVPLAMAASVAGAVLLMLEWQREENAPPPVQAEIREQDRTAAASGSASAPLSEAPMLAKPTVPAIPKAAHKALADSAPASTAADKRAEAPVSAYGAPPPPPALVPSAAPAPAPLAMPAPAVIAEASRVAPAPARALRAPPGAPAPAELAGPGATDPKAAAWLNVIDEMLKADLRKDALAEWEKFRLAYPGYPVPEALAKRIAAIK